MSKLATDVQVTQTTEIRDFLLKTFDSILDDTKILKTSKIEQCHKKAISLKAFDLVSISMSLIGYIGYRWNQERYYKTLNILNDAHYLANSSNSLLALKINMYLMAQIEFFEQNYSQSLELIEAALHIKLEDTLHSRVIGQSDAVTAISKAIRRARVGLKSPNRPIGSFIFSGPTGVGKTELAKALAEAIFGSEDNMELLAELRELGVAPVYVDTSALPLAGQSYIISGTIAGFGREEAEERLRARGATITKSVTKAPPALIVGEKPGKSKLNKAQQLGVPVLGGADYLQMIGE